MSLRENERRILAEIEHQLSTDDPELAEALASFDGGDRFSSEEIAETWKPWAICAAIASVVAGLLVVLFLAIPGPQPSGEDALSPRPNGMVMQMRVR